MVENVETQPLHEGASANSSLLLSHVSNNYFTASENSTISYDSIDSAKVVVENTPDIENDMSNNNVHSLSPLCHKGKKKETKYFEE